MPSKGLGLPGIAPAVTRKPGVRPLAPGLGNQVKKTSIPTMRMKTPMAPPAIGAPLAKPNLGSVGVKPNITPTPMLGGGLLGRKKRY